MPSTPRRTLLGLLAGGAILPGAHAEPAWPSRAIRFVVPFAAGGPAPYPRGPRRTTRRGDGPSSQRAHAHRLRRSPRRRDRLVRVDRAPPDVDRALPRPGARRLGGVAPRRRLRRGRRRASRGGRPDLGAAGAARRQHRGDGAHPGLGGRLPRIRRRGGRHRDDAGGHDSNQQNYHGRLPARDVRPVRMACHASYELHTGAGGERWGRAEATYIVPIMRADRSA